MASPAKDLSGPLVKINHETLLVLRYKVALVGDAAVGKTALSTMFETGGADFPTDYAMTVGSDVRVKGVRVKETNALVELYLLDGSGQTIFNQREFGTTLWPSANAVVVVYDVSSRESFTSCSKWLRRFADVRPGKKLVGTVIANKVDLEADDRRTVSTEEGEEFASSVGLAYVETSAKNGTGVDDAFEGIAEHCYNAYEQRMRAVESLVAP